MPARMYSGTSDVAAHFNPWTQNALDLMKSGVFAGFQRGTGRPAFIDFQGNIKDNKIKSGEIAVVGPKRTGKDTLCKCLATSLGGMQAGVNPEGSHVTPTLWVYDLKREAGRGEWTKVTDFYQEEPTVFAKGASFNLTAHHPGVTADDHARLINLIVRAQTKHFATSYQLLGLQLVIDQLHEKKVEFNPDLIARLMHRIDQSQLKVYMDSGLDDLRVRHTDRMEHDEDFAALMTPIFTKAPALVEDSYLFERFKLEVADYAAAINGLVKIAEYGKIWSGTDSIYDLMGRRFCHWDLNGLDELASNSMELALEFAQDILAGEGDGNSPLMPHYVFYDEQGSAMSSEPHAALRAERSRKKRATKSIEFMLYQNFDDPLKIGEVGSPMRGHGKTIFEGTDAFLVSGIPDDDEILDLVTKKGATDFEAYVMTTQEQGQWAFLAKGYPVEFFDHYVLPPQMNLIDTESAARIAAERRNVTDTEVFQERMRIIEGMNQTVPVLA